MDNREGGFAGGAGGGGGAPLHLLHPGHSRPHHRPHPPLHLPSYHQKEPAYHARPAPCHLLSMRCLRTGSPITSAKLPTELRENTFSTGNPKPEVLTFQEN